MDPRLVVDPVLPTERLPRTLRGAVRGSAFASVTAGLLGAARLHQAVSRPLDRADVFARWQHVWYRTLLELFSVQLSVGGDAAATAGRARLVVSNHRSTLDIVVLGWLFGGRLLSRADLAHWPLLGPAARAAGTIFVHRSSTGSSLAAARAIGEALTAGATVALFPEGTTFGDDEVRRFRRGSFQAALAAGAVVVPVGLAYDTSGHALFGDESFVRHALRVAAAPTIVAAARVGPALEASGTVDELAARARDAVQTLVHGARDDCHALERARARTP